MDALAATPHTNWFQASVDACDGTRAISPSKSFSSVASFRCESQLSLDNATCRTLLGETSTHARNILRSWVDVVDVKKSKWRLYTQQGFTVSPI
ncbi:hypothetical protein QE152_g27507 [Popillia japonica]|uniref:Uncharacterized protein n=1 Tax=Popillia japonica TaxID=7064 RepID=A0AAW1JSB3_POPJA